MKRHTITLLCCVACATLFADIEIPADKSKFKIVVLAGQSNMAGRGIPTDADKIPHPRVVMMDQAGQWVPCTDPIHFDKKTAGVGPGKTFAEALAESDPSIVVGVVPCAVGGTMITSWLPDAPAMLMDRHVNPPKKLTLHQNAVERVKKAMTRGTLTAILWHQGESDHARGSWFAYQALFPLFIDGFRRELNAESIPLICGGLYPRLANSPFGKIHSNTQRWTCEYAFGPGKFVPCPEDCQLNRDKLHYSRDSQVEFGKRYFAAYQEVVNALAKNKDYWKNPKAEAAKIKTYDIADWKTDDVDRQLNAVPTNLPVIVEEWLFPNGRQTVKPTAASECK